jgi:hypothetical protein
MSALGQKQTLLALSVPEHEGLNGQQQTLEPEEVWRARSRLYRPVEADTPEEAESFEARSSWLLV